eukprot:4219761-Alexandrium_andersonii.AAC.2
MLHSVHVRRPDNLWTSLVARAVARMKSRAGCCGHAQISRSCGCVLPQTSPTPSLAMHLPLT